MSNPIRLERVYDAPVKQVWEALTVPELMKQWYFDLPGFKAEVGYEFQFKAGPDQDSQYLHLCRVKEVNVYKKLSYSWRYDGYPGDSLVSFELFEEGLKTRLVLTHDGIESFEKYHKDFAKSNFAEGWTYFVNKALRGFLEPGIRNDFSIAVIYQQTAEKVYDSINRIDAWWTEDFEGKSGGEGDTFTIRFGNTQKSFTVKEMIPGRRIVWNCTEAYIDMASLKNKSEWKGTDIIWELTGENGSTKLVFTHKGLTSKLQCYEICEDGWDYYIKSLGSLVNEGKGNPDSR